MDRRAFIEACAAGAVAGVLPAMPAVASEPASHATRDVICEAVKCRRVSDQRWEVEVSYSDGTYLNFATAPGRTPMPKLCIDMVGKPRQSFICVTG